MKKWVYLVVLLGACVFGYAQGNGGDGVRGLAAFQSSIVRPVAVVGRGAGHYFFDFGKDAFGSLSVLLKAAQADSLVVHVGEKLRGSFEIDRAPGEACAISDWFCAVCRWVETIRWCLRPMRGMSGLRRSRCRILLEG
ncbi:hypothetical protein ACQ86N_29645 [Puia sp. P3]|uniref:hypothetical protein n=1 Tax=Puia sp. P3 TaxID=3423952 RepID=UPI003D66B0F6